MSKCSKSQYKDDRHNWCGPNTIGNWPYKVSWCGDCFIVRVQREEEDRMGGEVWTTLAEVQG